MSPPRPVESDRQASPGAATASSGWRPGRKPALGFAFQVILFTVQIWIRLSRDDLCSRERKLPISSPSTTRLKPRLIFVSGLIVALGRAGADLASHLS